MSWPDDKPKRSGYGDIFSGFILILSVAFALQAWSDITRYADLRADGVTTEGYWVSSYTNPADTRSYGIYYFAVGYKTYNNQQVLDDPTQYTKSGDLVSIVYLPYDPNWSRIAGTENYSYKSVVLGILSAISAILSLQYLIAYYTQRSAWIFKLVAIAKRVLNQQSYPSLPQEEIQRRAYEKEVQMRRYRRNIKRGIIAGVSIAVLLALGILIDSI